jgi:hypothetical protein
MVKRMSKDDIAHHKKEMKMTIIFVVLLLAFVIVLLWKMGLLSTESQEMMDKAEGYCFLHGHYGGMVDKSFNEIDKGSGIYTFKCKNTYAFMSNNITGVNLMMKVE